ncbi:MAG: DinB family protein [Chloroflexi bacterium]|nr:DinB family protein [Chloroflexota bacterium]
MDTAQRNELLARYKDGHRAVVEALADITDAELDVRPAEGWTARETAHHLADSEMSSAIRLRRLLAEDRPVLEGYDENEFARRLSYGDRPIAASLDTLRSVRQTSAEIAERLTEAEWAREGTHTESGRYTVEDWLTIYASHAHDHAEQIRRARSSAQ